jgi:hypothetical protein
MVGRQYTNGAMDPGEILLRATAWLSLLGWAASECLKAGAAAGGPRARRSRALFTAGAFFLLVHTALAFHLRYAWSHTQAADDIARQTRAVTGLGFAGGLYVNEVFLALWLLEALWWWRAPARYRARGRAFDWPVRAFFLTMFVNGAVVFVPGAQRWAGALAILAVLAAWYRAATGEPEVAHG